MAQLETLDILVTGTRGRVGGAIVPGLSETFNVTEFDIALPGLDKPGYDERNIRGDITEFEVVLDALRRVKPDCIVHLAANANQDAPAEDIVEPNYTGFRNVYDAAVLCHIPKIVFASSLHTLSGYPGFPNKSPFADGRKFNPSDEPNPGNPYGESKVWGEALAREYYDQAGIRTTVLRIGDLNPENKPAEPPYTQFRPIWLSHRDAVQIFSKAIRTETREPVATYFATSQKDGPYDLTSAAIDLGYTPEDGIDLQQYAEEPVERVINSATEQS